MRMELTKIYLRYYPPGADFSFFVLLHLKKIIIIISSILPGISLMFVGGAQNLIRTIDCLHLNTK